MLKILLINIKKLNINFLEAHKKDLIIQIIKIIKASKIPHLN